MAKGTLRSRKINFSQHLHYSISFFGMGDFSLHLQIAEKVSIKTLCHAALISASHKINTLETPIQVRDDMKILFQQPVNKSARKQIA